MDHSCFYLLQTKLCNISNQIKILKIDLLVDLRDFFSDLGTDGRKKRDKKSLKMTS